MFSPEQLATIFYKDERHQKEFLDSFDDVVEFVESDWKKIKLENLSDPIIKDKILKTIFFAQYSYSGVNSMILQSLEDWSAFTLFFEDLSEQDSNFYDLVYSFLGFLSFEFIKESTQIFLLAHKFLFLANIWDLDVVGHVRNYFSFDDNVNRLKNKSAMFAMALYLNDTMLGEEGKTLLSINKWIEKYLQKGYEYDEELSQEKRINYFFEDNLETDRLSPELREVLKNIFILYDGVYKGIFWRELGYSFSPIETVNKKERKPVFKIEEYYLRELQKIDESGIEVWLDSYRDFFSWLIIRDSDEKFIRKVIFEISKKIDLSKQENIDRVFAFLDVLNNMEIENLDGILFFDDEKNAFVWDSDYFIF